jgi:hypothetical protein
VRDRFIEALASGASVRGACEAAGIGRRTAYDMRDADEAFRAAWDLAIDEGTDLMEDEAYRRAVHGTAKPVYQGGKKVGTVQEHSDTLMVFMLKARRPEKFKDRGAVELTGKDGGPIETEEVSGRDMLARRIAGLAARTGEDGGSRKPH